MVLLLLLQALWFIAPAYVANGFPPVVRGKKPLDFRKKLGKQRVFGDGKTFEGTIGGILAGIFVGLVQITYQSQLPPELGLLHFTLPIVVALSIGAIFGDLIGAFIKRRMGMPRGHPAWLLDQLDFLTVSILAVSIFYKPSADIILTLFLLTPPIHWLTNYIAYKAKIKKTPW